MAVTYSVIQNNWLLTERRKGVDLACLIRQYLRMCDTYDLGDGSPIAARKAGTKETLMEMADRLAMGNKGDESWAVFHKKQLSKSEVNRKRKEVEDATLWFFQSTWEKDRKLNEEDSNAEVTTDSRTPTG